MIPQLFNRRIVRYIGVGGVAYLVEMGGLYVLKNSLHLSSLLAVSVSFWIGFCVAFGLQKVVTFQNYEKHPRAISRQLVFYSFLTAWNYLFTLAVVAALRNVLSVFIIRTVAILIITSWNFWLYSKLFRNRSN